MTRHIGHIDEEIAAYAAHAGAGEGGEPGSLYSSEDLAEIYQPRVQQLIDLKNQGFIYAEWKWDPEVGHNRWHGLTDQQRKEVTE